MPNHCYNVLSLTSDPQKTYKTLKKFISKDKEGNEFFDFNKVIKMPRALNVESTSQPTPELAKRYEENLKNYGHKTWYEWSNANWGTKWNSYDFQAQDECISFSTAWAPPEPVITELAEKTKQDWTLRYCEEGMDFCGQLDALKTGATNHQQWSLKEAPQEFRDEMGISEEDIYSEEELLEMKRERERIEKMKEKLKRGVKSKKGDEIGGL